MVPGITPLGKVADGDPLRNAAHGIEARKKQITGQGPTGGGTKTIAAIKKW